MAPVLIGEFGQLSSATIHDLWAPVAEPASGRQIIQAGDHALDFGQILVRAPAAAP
jgi:hypothetical protein